MTDIEKALISQKKTNLRTILLSHYHKFLNVFNCMMTEKLSLLKEEDTNYWIKLKEIDEKESKVFWDSLYNITKKKLLMLCKTLTELLNKQFIQVSNLLSWVCNETDTWLIIFKYKKNTMKGKRRASYRSKKIMCFSLRVLVSN